MSVIIILAVLLGMVRFLFTEKDFTLLKKERILPRIETLDDDSLKVVLPSIATEPTYIGLTGAKQLFNTREALFIDARDTTDFGNLHISGAINIPFDYYEDHLSKLQQTDTSSVIVTYCSGDECDLSVELGDVLFYDLNYHHVFVFDGGMNYWIEEGLPTE